MSFQFIIKTVARPIMYMAGNLVHTRSLMVYCVRLEPSPSSTCPFMVHSIDCKVIDGTVHGLGTWPLGRHCSV